MKCSRCGAFASGKVDEFFCDCDEAESHKADEIAALKLALVEMTVARDEAVAIAESAATWLEANTDKSARRGVAKLVHAKLPRLRSVGKKAP